MLCSSGFELYSRWVPLNLFLFLIQSDKRQSYILNCVKENLNTKLKTLRILPFSF